MPVTVVASMSKRSAKPSRSRTSGAREAFGTGSTEVAPGKSIYTDVLIQVEVWDAAGTRHSGHPRNARPCRSPEGTWIRLIAPEKRDIPRIREPWSLGGIGADLDVPSPGPASTNARLQTRSPESSRRPAIGRAGPRAATATTLNQPPDHSSTALGGARAPGAHRPPGRSSAVGEDPAGRRGRPPPGWYAPRRSAPARRCPGNRL